MIGGPDDSSTLSQQGNARDAQEVTCVLTHVRLRSVFQMPLALWAFHSINQTLPTRDLIYSSLLVEGPRSFVTWSIWRDPRALEAIGRSQRHVEAVRKVYRGWSLAAWSTQWHLTRISPSSRGLPRDLAALSRVVRLGMPGIVSACGHGVAGREAAV